MNCIQESGVADVKTPHSKAELGLRLSDSMTWGCFTS